jgi:hypothetical protein
VTDTICESIVENETRNGMNECDAQINEWTRKETNSGRRGGRTQKKTIKKNVCVCCSVQSDVGVEKCVARTRETAKTGFATPTMPTVGVAGSRRR